MAQLDHYEKFRSTLSKAELIKAPEHLYMSGDTELLSYGRRVSFVGSRKVSDKGARRAKMVAEALVAEGITVVSGLAEGVDTIAHTTAIRNSGRTIGVLGTPINRSYPAKNKELQAYMAENHLVVSQFAEGVNVGASAFPQRNRTMALISDATIIIEASEKSGTKHQGWEALRLNRPLFLLDSLFTERNLSWVHEMMEYGAHRLMRDDLEGHLQELLPLTSYAHVEF